MNNNSFLRRLLIIFILFAMAFGALYMWSHRYAMNPDGLVYLDLGDAIFQGGLSKAINACFSPLYPFLLGLVLYFLKPSPYWEFPVVHLVNFLIYLFALGSFIFFLFELLKHHRVRATKVSRDGDTLLPEWALFVLGGTLFIWSSLNLICIWLVTPDMLVSAFVYLAAGILLRIKRQNGGWFNFIFLGVVFGLGYFAKTPVFVMAIFFLGCGFFLVSPPRRAIPLFFTVLLIFLSIAGPYIIALSKAQGYLTIGDSYKALCAGYECKNTVHWQGEPLGSGAPAHPTRKLFNKPAIFEFGSPIEATYPPVYDPSYWNKGIISSPDIKQVLKAAYMGFKHYFYLFLYTQAWLVMGCLILYFMSRWRLFLIDIRAYWFLLFPSLLVLIGYGLIGKVRERYIAEFITLIWIIIFAAIRLSSSPESKRLIRTTVCIIALYVLITNSLQSFYRLLKSKDVSGGLLASQIACTLKQMGVQPKDRVATIGDWGGGFHGQWARLARVRMVAEIPGEEEGNFWTADDTVKAQVINILKGTGAKIIVSKIPDYVSWKGWRRIGNTDYICYIFK